VTRVVADAQSLSSPTRRSRATGAVVVLVVLAIVALAGGTWLLGRDDAPLPGILRDPPLDATGLEFTDYAASDTGEPAGLVPPPGEITLAYFGYLSCPDVCPTTMADIRVALLQLPPEEVARVDVAFVTVDPERDSGPDIRDYLAMFFADQPVDLQALRADGDTSLQTAADRLGLTWQVAEHEPGAARYDVAHSAITYVVAPDGTVARELPFGATPDEFAQVITTTLPD
jgi:protein SCO1/2